MELTDNFSYKYSPVIKTTDAELKGYEKLDDSVKDQILPVFELTRSRKSKKNMIQAVSKRMNSIEGIVGLERPVILDITSHDDLQNEEIESFADETHGFANWCEFVEDYRSRINVIPVIHMLPPTEDPGGEVQKQIKRLIDGQYDALAFRFSPFDFEREDGITNDDELLVELTAYIKIILKHLDAKDLILILDAQYIDQSVIKRKSNTISKLLVFVSQYDFKLVSVVSSSFPSYVVGHESGCNDDEGYITILEKQFFQMVCSGYESNNLIYGDYASIHPIRSGPQGGGSWVPRIDFPLSTVSLYKRYRRDNGGYITCARELVQDEDFIANPNPCWGACMIDSANRGDPEGKSPSFWISVRVNLFISRLFNGDELPLCLCK